MKFKFGVVLLFVISSCSSNKDLNYAVNDPVLISKSEKNEISLITYNTQTVFGKEDSKRNGLLSYLNSEPYDFVTLQELFNENDRNSFVKDLSNSSYISITPRVDYTSFPSLIFQDAGLFSASKYPLVDLSSFDFGENTETNNGAIHQLLFKEISFSLDFLSNKSVLGTLHQVDDSTKLFLFTTHLQALSSKRHKTNQLKQIKAFIENALNVLLKNNVITNPKNLIVLLTGDFNFSAYDENDFERVHKFLGRPRDLYQEFNSEIQEYTLIKKFIGLYRRVDYIFAYDYIGKIPLRKVGVKSINVTDVVDKDNESVSDHMAIKATLILD